MSDHRIHPTGERPVYVEQRPRRGNIRDTQLFLDPQFEVLPPTRRRRREGRLWDVAIRLGEASQLVQWAVVIGAGGYLLGRLWPLLPVIWAHVQAGVRP